MPHTTPADHFEIEGQAAFARRTSLVPVNQFQYEPGDPIATACRTGVGLKLHDQREQVPAQVQPTVVSCKSNFMIQGVRHLAINAQ